MLPRKCKIRNFASIPQTFSGCCGLQLLADPYLHSSSGADWGGGGAGPALLLLQELPAYTARVNEHAALGERKGTYFGCLMTRHHASDVLGLCDSSVRCD